MRYLMLALLLVISLVILPQTTRAAEDFTLDFDAAGLTYTLADGAALGDGRSGQGAIEPSVSYGGGLWQYFVTVQIELPAGCTVTEIKYWFFHNKYNNAITTRKYAFNGGAYTTINFNATGATWNEVTITPPTPVEATSLTLHIEYGDTQSNRSLKMDDITVTCSGVLIAAFSGEPDSGYAPLEVAFTDESYGEVTSWAWDFDDEGTSTTQNPTHTFEEPGEYLVTLTVTGPDGTDTEEILWTVMDEGGGGGLTRPLAAEDEHEQWGMFDNQYVQDIEPEFPITTTYPYMIYALANQPNANVSSVADGKVIYTRPFDKFQDCSTFLSSLVYCLFIIPQPITQETSAYIFTFEMINISVIYIEDADDPEKVYKYYVANATVQTGDEVVAGCIIGQTIQIKNLTEAELSSISAGGGASLGADEISAGVSIGGDLSIRTLLVNAGVTIIHYFVGEERERLLPQLTMPPNQTNCQEQTLSHCVNPDSTMRSLNQDSWLATENGTEVSGTAASLLSGGGISIAPYAGIIQQGITVDPEVTYTLSFQARRVDPKVPNEIIRVIVGDQVFEVGLTQQFINYTFTPTSVFNSLPIVFRNETTSYVEILYACLADSTASTAPGACYFANNEFDADGASWLFTDVTFASGQAYMSHGSTLGQEATLNANADSSPHTYTISAQARLIANASYTGQVGKSVTLEYKFPSTESYTTLGTIDSALVISQGLNPVSGTVQFDYPYQFSDELAVSTTTISGFYFQTSITDGDNYITGLRLDWVCITPGTDDGSFPGQPGEGGFEPPFIEGCAVVPLPIDGSVAAWTYYHWSQLNRFFQCDLMKLLNNWFKLFDSFRRTMLYVARYWIALVNHFTRWLTQLIWWMNGHFQNIAVGQVVIIEEAGGGCNGDILCNIANIISTLANSFQPVVDALANVVNVLLGLIIGAANLFFTLVGGLLGFVVALVIRLFVFLQTGQGLLTSIVTAYSTAAPTAIPGLPMCATDPSSSLICNWVWVADNTILGGRWGILFTLLLSIGSIHLILWVINEFRNIVLKTWPAS